MTPFIIRLTNLRRSDTRAVGTKAAVLGELAALGFPVPDGFCVTVAASKAATGHRPAADRPLNPAELDDQRPRILDTELPDNLPTDIEDAVQSLRLVAPNCALYAVRSSSSVEDTFTHSFAGQFRTLLVPADAVPDAVLQCWSSLYDDAPSDLVAHLGLAPSALRMGVLIQSVVPADKSGVIFTCDPVTGESMIIIEASWGLGEPIVGGRITPDHIRVDTSGHVRQYRIGSKKRLLSAAGGTLQDAAVDPEAAARKCLDRREIDLLVGMARRVEQALGPRQDLEFAFYDGDGWVLQARPITTLIEPDHRPTTQEGQY